MQALFDTLTERKQLSYYDRHAVSLDNELVVTGCITTPLSVWRMKDATLAHTVDGQWTVWIFSLAISPDNKLVARGDENGNTEIRDVASNSFVASLCHGKNAITAVAFSHDGQFLATVSDLWKIAVWDLHTKTLLLSQSGEIEQTCKTVTFSHDNSLVISEWSCGTIHVWNWRLNQVCHLKRPSDGVLRVDCLVGTQYIACQSARQWVEVWDPYSKSCVVAEQGIRCYTYFTTALNHCTTLPSPRFLLYFLLSKGLCLPVSHPWALFLKRGLYDPRLWLQVAAFLWSSDSKSA